MKVRFLFPLVLLTLFQYSLMAQKENYTFSNIPQELLKKANAVIRLNEIDINIISIDKMEVTEKRVVTVLNKNGNRAIQAYVQYNPSIKVKKLEARVFDAFGTEIKKYKKNDFTDTSAVSGGTLYQDERVKYISYTPTTYPYTIEFINVTNTVNTAFVHPWFPVDNYWLSVEKSRYKLQYPSDLEIRKKEKYFKGFTVSKEEQPGVVSYELSNSPAMVYEEGSAMFVDRVPALKVALNKFHLEGVDGEAKDWKSFGKWRYDEMIVDRDVLSQETIQKVSGLVEGINDPIEKAKKIYEYVQDNTRYISVQLGIGGWEPISAEEVDRVKYGDCKGLTNYTKALLKSQGIESNYAVIWAGDEKRSMETDFASMQGNHVILNLPNGQGEDIWLECTSQTLPFGFLGNFTDDRDALLLKSEGGELAHTTSYLNEDNYQKTQAEYLIDATGKLSAKVAITTKGSQFYNRFSRLYTASEKEKQAHYKEYWGHINDIQVNEIAHTTDRDQITFSEDVKISAAKYVVQSGDRLIFAPNAFNKYSYVPKRYRNRTSSFEESRGFLDEDEFIIHLPEGYTVENLPVMAPIENEFGSYEAVTEMKEDGNILYKRKFFMKKGTFPKESYNDYRNFLRQVNKSDNAKIVLLKSK